MSPKSLATLLRALSTPRRVEILLLLLGSPDPLPSSTISTMVGIRDSSASFNLLELAQVGLVLRQPSGRYVFWSPNRTLVRDVFSAFTKESE